MHALAAGGFALDSHLVTRRAEFETALSAGGFELVLAAYRLTDWTGMDALALLRARGSDLPFLLIDSLDTETAVACVRQGAADWVSREALDRLPQAVTQALRDHSARREQARQFLHAQRLEAVGQLAGGIAHDFNNILTSVLGFSQFLIDQLPESDPLRADAQEIYRAGELAAVLTRKLLAFSRRQPMRPEVLDLNHVIDESTRMLSRLLGEDIRIELETGAQPALVQADPGQLEQVVLNLAINARDAMPQGGRLSVRTSRVQLDASLRHAGGVVPPGCYVLLRVADDGAGMTPDVLDRIFEPFFTTKGGTRGTGLGLSTVYGILQQAGAHVLVQSEPGRGSTFDLYFPAAQAELPASAVHRPLGAAWGDERILVVEDQPAIRALAERVLIRAGYAVLTAGSGDEARLLARQTSRLHLIVMDILLPGERGPRVAADLRQQHPDARLVFISGNNGVAEEAYLPEGRHWFLQKPFTPEQLLATVRSALDAPVTSTTIAPESGRS